MLSNRLHASQRALALLALLVGALLSTGVTDQAAAAPLPNYSLAVSVNPDRSSAQPLAGRTYAQPASIHVFTTPTTSARRVRFYLDDVTMSRAPRMIETGAPFDFAGTASDGSAIALDVSTLSAASHTITAAVEATNGKTRIISASFTVTSGLDTSSPTTPALTSTSGDQSVALTWTGATDNVGVTRYEVWKDNGWVAGLPETARSHNVAGLAAGVSHSFRVVAYDAVGNYANSNTVTAAADAGEPPPPPPSGSDPSGEPAPAGNLPGWRQIFLDDFSRDVPLGSFPAAVSDKWSAYPSTWRDTSRNGWYDPERVISIREGMMDMFLHTETINGVKKHLVAAPHPRLPISDPAVSEIVASEGVYSYQSYGRYAVRFRADPLPGYKTAWLLWPKSNTWPRDGEIDFPEGDLNGNICAFMHRMNGLSGSDQDGACTSHVFPTWHTAVIEWTPTVCRFILDGNVILAPTSRIPSTPMRWVLQTETTLDGIAPADSTAGHVQIDWVAAWARAA